MIPKQLNTSWKEKKIEWLETCYGGYARMYDDRYHDDRQIVVNVYNMIMEALESLPDEPNNYVCCAINDKIEEDVELMKRIIRRFESKPQWFDLYV